MSSIHDIGRIEEAQKSMFDQALQSQQVTLAQKSQEQIKDELDNFKHSINEIDSKFVILNNNLIKYQELTDHARNALLSRDATSNK